MTWNCISIEERLTDYLDGQLGSAERAELEAHLAGCASCTALVAGVRGLVSGLHRLEPIAEPSGLILRILEQTSGLAQRKAESSRTWTLAAIFTPRMALGLASVAATLFILFQAAGINPKKITLAQLNPLEMARSMNRQAHLTYARSAKFVNDLRVVYEIRSRLQEASATRPEPQQPQTPAPASPQTERQLKNDLLRHRSSLIAAGGLAGLPGRERL
jgi:anti-sigma factor RsiW